MEKIYRSALVSYSAEQMFRLVNDVARYPEFVPNCQSATILEQSEDIIRAELAVAKSGIAKSFATENRLTPFKTIEMVLIDGPFKHLSGKWQFTPLGDAACKIELEVAFEFKNKLASLAFSGIFSQLIQSMVQAFTERANKIYG